MKKVSLLGISAILGMMALGGDVNASIVSRGFLDNALTDYVKTTALDLKANQSDLTDLSNKIGKLPEGLTVANLYDGWTDSDGEMYYGLKAIDGYISKFTKLPKTTLLYSPDFEGPKYLQPSELGVDNYFDILKSLLTGSDEEQDGGFFSSRATLAPFWYLTKQALKLGNLPEGITVQGMYDGWTDKTTNTKHLGITGLNDAIGTLPTGMFPDFPAYQDFFSFAKQPFNYPTSLEELITALYGDSKTGTMGLLGAIVAGYFYDANLDVSYGLIPAVMSAYKARTTAEANTVKIGTLPTGNMPAAPVWSDKLLPNGGFEPIYPTSLAGLMELLFGNDQKSSMGILQQMIAGFPIGDGTDNMLGIYPNYVLAKDAKELATTANTTANTANETANAAKSAADANTAKIGTLPTEYATVGAALTAMDAKIEAKDLPADSDDGQYVLSAKKVGDTITYTWVKMDLTDAEK